MVEYVILLASTAGGQLLDRAAHALTDDPVLIFGGAAVLLLLMGWVLKPNR